MERGSLNLYAQNRPRHGGTGGKEAHAPWHIWGKKRYILFMLLLRGCTQAEWQEAWGGKWWQRRSVCQTQKSSVENKNQALGYICSPFEKYTNPDFMTCKWLRLHKTTSSAKNTYAVLWHFTSGNLRCSLESSLDYIQWITTFIEASVEVTKSIYDPHCHCKALALNLNRNAVGSGIKWTDVRLEDKARPQNSAALALTIHLLIENAHRTA